MTKDEQGSKLICGNPFFRRQNCGKLKVSKLCVWGGGTFRFSIERFNKKSEVLFKEDG